MTTAILDTPTWAKQNFECCELGDVRRNKRLMKLAIQVADRPDGSFPDQTETWGDIVKYSKGQAYYWRLGNEARMVFDVFR